MRVSAWKVGWQGLRKLKREVEGELDLDPGGTGISARGHSDLKKA